MTKGKTPPGLPENVVPYPVVANIEFPEGPTFDEYGNFYFVNYLCAGTIGRMTPDGTVSVWVHTGGSGGGIKYDGKGHILAADGTRFRITRFDIFTRRMEVLACGYGGTPFLGPNDLCLDIAGNIYFSDPGRRVLGLRGAIYRIDMGPDNQPTRVVKLDDDLPFPNGIAVHPDQSRLYLATSDTNSIIAYDIGPGGGLDKRRTVYRFPDESVDGIRFDEYGRLWVARWTHGTVDVLDVERGQVLAGYRMGGSQVTNLCWWGTSLFVTVKSQHSIERLDVQVRGADTYS